MEMVSSWRLGAMLVFLVTAEVCLKMVEELNKELEGSDRQIMKPDCAAEKNNSKSSTE